MTGPQDVQPTGEPPAAPETPAAPAPTESFTPAAAAAEPPAEAAATGQVAWSSPPPQAWGQSAAPPAPPAQPPASPWMAAPAAAPRADSGSGAVAIAGVILAVAGGLLLLVGGLFVLGGAALVGSGGILNETSNPEIPEGWFGPIGGFIIGFGAMFVLYGLLDIVAAVGVFMRREWGRFFGAVLAGIAAVLTTLVGLASLGSLANSTGSVVFFLVTVLFAIAYWFALIALARNGAAFRRT